jgi:hypothetical protein
MEKAAVHGWIIDTDYFPSKDSPEGTHCNAKGLTGPHNLSSNLLNQLLQGVGRRFRMRDADNEILYEGRIITSEDQIGSALDFTPLDGYGKSSGATGIEYLRSDGVWEEL